MGKQTIQINEYLMNDRNKAQETLTVLRNENNAKFESLQKEIERLSREHLYNLKEYLVYRRNTKQEIEDLQMNFLQMKHQNNKIKQKCNHKLDKIKSNTNKIKKKLKNSSNKKINKLQNGGNEKT